MLYDAWVSSQHRWCTNFGRWLSPRSQRLCIWPLPKGACSFYRQFVQLLSLLISLFERYATLPFPKLCGLPLHLPGAQLLRGRVWRICRVGT